MNDPQLVEVNDALNAQVVEIIYPQLVEVNDPLNVTIRRNS